MAVAGSQVVPVKPRCLQKRTLLFGLLVICSCQLLALQHFTVLLERRNTDLKKFKAPFLSEIDFRLISNGDDEFGSKWGDSHRIVKRELTESFLTPNEVLRRTAIAIKTFNRPDCFNMTLTSFKSLYPDIPIFVADDSFDDVLKNTPGIHYIRMPPDSGTAAGRNALVDAIHQAGFEYMVMSDDDYVIDDYDDLLTMAHHLLQTGADVLAPLRCDYGKCDRSKGMIFIDESRDIIIFPNITQYPPEDVPGCHRTDVLQQFFISRTETLKRVHWDDVLKNNDHYDFLYNAKSNGLKLVTCTDVRILHDKKTCQQKSKNSKQYSQVRQQRWITLTNYIFEKWSIRHLVDEVGKRIWIQNGEPQFVTPNKTIIDSHHHLHDYFISSAITHMNAKSAGWTWFRPILPSRKNYLFYVQHHPCVYYFRGKLHVEYDRDPAVANKQQLVTFDTYHFNETCEYAEHLWTVPHYGVETGQRHVYYVVAVANDMAHLLRLLQYLDKTSNKKRTTVIIVDMGKAGNRVKDEHGNISLPVYLMYVGSPFSRSIGLKKGVEIALKDSARRKYVDAVAFAIDTSIITPSNFTETILRNVRCGITAYAPIVYKFKEEEEGYWVNPGYGMLGFCLSDYVMAGGYDDRWGYRWGAEDVDLTNRMSRIVKYIVRPQQEGLFHVHNYHTRKTFKAYYAKKNMYDKELPLTPLTTPIGDPNLEERLCRFMLQYLQHANEKNSTELAPKNSTNSQISKLLVLTMNSAHRTRMNNGEKLIYDIRMKGNDGNTYWAIVNSILTAELNILDKVDHKPFKS